MLHRITLIVSLLTLLVSFNARAQVLTADQLIQYPTYQADNIGSELVKSGWKQQNIEFVPDSNFIRRTWEAVNKKTGVKWYFLFYEFTKDTAENYIIYQFSDKELFASYKKELKSKGYKLLNPEKKKRRRSDGIQREKDELYYSEKTHSLTVVKEVFLYGLYSFLVYSYKPYSAIAKHVIHTKTNIEVEYD